MSQHNAQMARASFEPADVFAAVESQLSGHADFAAPSELNAAVVAVYQLGLDVLGTSSPSAAALAADLGSLSAVRIEGFLQDPVLRTAITEALTTLQQGGDLDSTLEEIFTAALLSLRTDSSRGGFERELMKPMRLETDTPSLETIVWNDSGRGPLSTRFRKVVSEGILSGDSGEPVRLINPSDDMNSAINEGMALLGEILPQLRGSVFRHVRYVNIVDEDGAQQADSFERPNLFESASTDTIPCCVFFSVNPLASAWRTAEALLHEAAHNKLFELILTRPILRNGYSQTTSPTILAFWNSNIPSNPNDWCVDRALLAFHVYVHLTLFLAVIEHRGQPLEERFGDITGPTVGSAASTAYARADYLGQQLLTTGAAEIGPDGFALIEWLMSLLTMLSPFTGGGTA